MCQEILIKLHDTTSLSWKNHTLNVQTQVIEYAAGHLTFMHSRSFPLKCELNVFLCTPVQECLHVSQKSKFNICHQNRWLYNVTARMSECLSVYICPHLPTFSKLFFTYSDIILQCLYKFSNQNIVIYSSNWTKGNYSLKSYYPWWNKSTSYRENKITIHDQERQKTLQVELAVPVLLGQCSLTAPLEPH